MEENFAIGDQVQLKSGGPIMTLSSLLDNDGTVECKWFSGEEVKHALFRAGTLKKARPPDYHLAR